MKILVIGDSCTDIFIYGNVSRLCPEAPVPVFEPSRTVTNDGMAGNVRANLESLGAKVNLITNKEQITKTRYVDSKSNQMFLRVDTLDKVKSAFDINRVDWNVDAVIVSDYDKGFLTENDINLISGRHPLTFIDTKKPINLQTFSDYTYIKMNEFEWELCEKKGARYDDWADKLIVTMSERGCLYQNEVYPVNTDIEVRDLSGAGDTFMASLVFKYVETKDLVESIKFANDCATKVVQKKRSNNDMNQIDFFGCSFTEAPMWEMLPKVGEFNLPLYSQHTQTTKPVSNFLEFDLAYNNIIDYKVNNFGGGSFGNHFIKEVIKNRVNEIDKTKDNIAIVQLSALLRNPHSFETIFTSQYSALTKIEKYNITCFDVKPENVRNDYFVEFDNIEDYYKSHIENIQEMVEVLRQNYKKYYIHFGWDVSTQDFEKLWEVSELNSVVNSWEYQFPLINLAYFENQEKYNRIDKKAAGKYGGMLEYSANKLDESLRYVHIKDDHHPSYFSNKIFYTEVIREFLNPMLNLNQNYFEREDLIKFEEFLKNLIPTKESTDGAIYAQFQTKIIKYIYNEILHK